MLFECPNDLKIVTISVNMLLNTLRKTIMDAIRGNKFLLDLFLLSTCFCKEK